MRGAQTVPQVALSSQDLAALRAVSQWRTSQYIAEGVQRWDVVSRLMGLGLVGYTDFSFEITELGAYVIEQSQGARPGEGMSVPLPEEARRS